MKENANVTEPGMNSQKEGANQMEGAIIKKRENRINGQRGATTSYREMEMSGQFAMFSKMEPYLSPPLLEDSFLVYSFALPTNELKATWLTCST